jgi:hypothetical protein
MKPTIFADADCLMHKGIIDEYAIKWTFRQNLQPPMDLLDLISGQEILKNPDKQQLEESMQYLRLAADIPDSFHGRT